MLISAMRAREDIIDIFSTYLRFEADRVRGWLTDPRLRKSIEICLTQGPDNQLSKHDWALYWHQHWQNQTHGLAVRHLGAYLQEVGYWTAYKVTSRFELKQFSLDDCFQVGFINFEKCLSSFQPDRGSTLESFAKLFFNSTLRNELRRAKEVDLCSDWLLLRKVSRKRFIESLENQGLDNPSVEQRRLAWVCFKRLYAPTKETGTQSLPPPSQSTWQAITELYNRERLTQLAVSGPTIAAEQIEAWLTECTGWVRTYLYPPVASLHAPRPGVEVGDLQDNLPADDLAPIDHLLRDLEQTSRQDQQSRLRQFLQDSLGTLAPAEQSLLRLYYNDHLTQQEIAQQLNIKQYAVSRKLTRVRKKLLDLLINCCEETAGHPPGDIEGMVEILEIWLRDFFDPPGPEGA